MLRITESQQKYQGICNTMFRFIFSLMILLPVCSAHAQVPMEYYNLKEDNHAHQDSVVKVELIRLTVEHQDGSQPLATAQPRFSWNYASGKKNVQQTSYRIIVASTEENARNNIGDLWDSKTVLSDQMLFIPYQGKALHSRDKAYWKVITSVKYKETGEVKIYRDMEYVKTESRPVTRIQFLESDVNSFEISLLDQDDWTAQWIGYDFGDDSLVQKTRLPARYLRKEFTLDGDIQKARLYISGLGVYSAYINYDINTGEVAPKEILKPALSDYTKRIYFNAYDVTDMLKKGENAIGVILEGGRYMTMRYNKKEEDWGGQYHVQHYGAPRLILQLEVTYQDGRQERIVSDGSWRITNQGPIRTANEFDGETYDENYDLGLWTTAGYEKSWKYDDSKWKWARSVYPPGGALMPQPNPNIQVQDIVHPIAMFRKGDAWIIDMGQNMVGCLDLLIRNLNPRDTVTLRFAETLNPDSALYTENLRDAEVTDRFIPAFQHGFQVWKWHPMFVYHGFRYVEINGLQNDPKLSDFEGLVFYDKMINTGHFYTDNEIINAVHKNAYWGIRGNYRSMPTDCPQRDERMGWTGDRTTGNYGESYIFDNYRLYSKWLTDIEDSQWPSGSLSDVCPAYWRRYTDNMTWPGAFITVADMLHTRFGDEKPIREHYPAMKKWMLHMKAHYMVDGILTRDCYGDWCMPPESPELVHSKDTTRITHAAAISTPFYCYLAGKMAQFAELIGIPEDATYFRQEVATTTEAYNRKYLDPKTGRYDNNTVTANILPLAFGMVPKELEDKVFSNIIDKTENEFDGHVSTGVVGIQQLMRTLTEHGRGDLAFKLASNDTYPSWGYMVRNGATTIWELWNGNTAAPYMNSGNHVMLLGDLILWDYEYLGGIRALEPGYRKIQLKPYPIDGLNRVVCTYESASGVIESSWKRIGDTFEWSILIPDNTTAEVWLPTAKGYEVKTYGSGWWQLKSGLK